MPMIEREEMTRVKARGKVWSHQRNQNGSDEWLTDPALLRALGDFDLDPAAPVVRPWDTARHHFTVLEDGLRQQWFGRVWLNPPYHRSVLPGWLAKMVDHGQGIAPIFARTDTDAVQKYVFDSDDGVLFIRGRLFFCRLDGTRARYNGGSPSILVAYGADNVDALRDSRIPGKLFLLNSAVTPVAISFPDAFGDARVGIADFGGATWKTIVEHSLRVLGGKGEISEIYEVVMKEAIEKFRTNRAWREQVRKVLQHHFVRLERGVWALPEAA